MNLRGVLFDLDGTLVDSEPMWQACETKIVESWGSSWSRELGNSCTGKPLAVTAQTMCNHCGHDEPIAQVVNQLVAQMVQTYRQDGVPWMPQALARVDELAAANIATAIVTSSYRCLLDEVLTIAGPHRFTTSLAGDEVSRTKPDPLPYLVAAEKLGISITDCVVVEDSASGIASGKAAGAFVVAVGTAAKWPQADGHVDSVGELTLLRLRQLTDAW